MWAGSHDDGVLQTPRTRGHKAETPFSSPEPGRALSHGESESAARGGVGHRRACHRPHGADSRAAGGAAGAGGEQSVASERCEGPPPSSGSRRCRARRTVIWLTPRWHRHLGFLRSPGLSGRTGGSSSAVWGTELPEGAPRTRSRGAARGVRCGGRGRPPAGNAESRRIPFPPNQVSRQQIKC